MAFFFFVAIFRCEMSKTPLGHLPVRLNYKGIICLPSKFEQEKRDDDLGFSERQENESRAVSSHGEDDKLSL